jgi:uncharacterized membrane protein YGL010W
VTRRRLTGAARLLERRRENVEILMGALGFFIVMLLGATVIAEVKGDNAVARALTLAVLVGLFYCLVRIRRVLQQRLDALLQGADANR